MQSSPTSACLELCREDHFPRLSFFSCHPCFPRCCWFLLASSSYLSLLSGPFTAPPVNPKAPLHTWCLAAADSQRSLCLQACSSWRHPVRDGCPAAVLYGCGCQFQLNLAGRVGMCPGAGQVPSPAAPQRGRLCPIVVPTQACSITPGLLPGLGTFLPRFWTASSPARGEGHTGHNSPSWANPAPSQGCGAQVEHVGPGPHHECKREIKPHQHLPPTLWISPPCFISIHFYFCEVKVSPIWKSACLRSSPQILLASRSISIHFC